MSNVTILFDEKSLVLTKDDYTAITKYSKVSEDMISWFMNQCFVVLKNNKPLLVAFFNKVHLEGRDCFEISRIKHELEVVPNLPDEYNEFNVEVGELIKKVFNLLDKAINTSNYSEFVLYYKYYIRNLKKKSYDIQLYQQRVNIASFVPKLSYVFGVTD
jgi:hypothetical protein